MEIRDPLHGAIPIDASEFAVVEHPYVQRLRAIHQTGFSYLAFPGATHSRYAHSLGVMHLAGKAFDGAYRSWSFSNEGVRQRYRQCVRIAALCHDLGHAPFSHCMEFAMPPLRDLGIGWYGPSVDQDRRATHEDYTIAILEGTSLSDVILENTPFTSHHVAALVCRDLEDLDDFFVDGGINHRGLLSQIISSELDVDRLDYLVRDAYYTGARYGQVDVGWLLSNMGTHILDDSARLSLDGRAVYAFDDFLISRHHMFLMVYFHHKSVIYEELLRRYIASEECSWVLPHDLDAYLHVDDISLMQHLRESTNPWSLRVVKQKPFRRVVERHGKPEEEGLAHDENLLVKAGIDHILATSTGRLSRYVSMTSKREQAPDIFVYERIPGMPVERIRPLSEATGVFERYADARVISRIYVPPESVREARGVLGLPISADET